MNKYIFALLVIVSGILYIAVPNTILPVCEYADIATPGHAAPVSGAGHGHAAPDIHTGHGHADAPPVHQVDSAKASAPAHMLCFWTARAEFGLGLLVIFGGLLLALSKTAERRLGVTLMLAGTAVFGAAIPYALIGVCLAESASCRAGTLPALLILSALLLLFSLINCRYLSAAGKGRRAGGNA